MVKRLWADYICHRLYEYNAKKLLKHNFFHNLNFKVLSNDAWSSAKLKSISYNPLWTIREKKKKKRILLNFYIRNNLPCKSKAILYVCYSTELTCISLNYNYNFEVYFYSYIKITHSLTCHISKFFS